MTTIERYEKLLQLSMIRAKEIETEIEEGDLEDFRDLHDSINGIIKRVQQRIDTIQGEMLDDDKSLDEIKQWSAIQKQELDQFRGIKEKIKIKIKELQEQEKMEQLQLEVQKQKLIQEEIKLRHREEQKEIEEATERRIQREEEWLKKKLDMEKDSTISHTVKPTSGQVKLQKYTITPFEGDYKDWTRFWNQFIVEVDGSTISEISKFNYLLELTKGKPKNDILGLPHTIEGYKEAKKILTDTYGKDFKVHRALVKELEGLQPITHIKKITSIHDFYNKLARVVRTLATMEKLDSVQSMVYGLMDKLGPVQRILAQGDDNWEEWKLQDLTENLRKFVERCPINPSEDKAADFHQHQRKDKLFMENSYQRKKSCIYCGIQDHRSAECTKVLTIASRREYLKRNNLCFNCTGKGHNVNFCRSRNCNKCGGKHHTSICNKLESTMPETSGKSSTEKNFGASSGLALHMMVKGIVNGQEVRIMVDNGSSSSYICSSLITTLDLQPFRKETRCIEQLFGTVTKMVELYNIKIKSTTGNHFTLDLKCINGEREILTHLPNPRIKQLKRHQRQLRHINFCDEETNIEQLPIHIILGVADYQRIRTTEPPILGNDPDNDPGAEYTMLGWILSGKIISAEGEGEKLFLTKTGQREFEQLCSLDVLGLADGEDNTTLFHEDFQEQLRFDEKGYYETKLPWKPDRPELSTNKELAIGRLRSTTKRLERMDKIQEYDEVMQDHIQNGIIEEIPEHTTGEVVYYVPHHAVIREEAESTKLRIVYDCSAKESPDKPSLNDCLETGPSLQPLLFDILLRNRMKYYCITGDIKKAFLQIRIHPQDRDALRVLWYKDLITKQIKEYRFSRAIFGAGPSPYILNATIKKHVGKFNSRYPETTKSLLTDTYVDDIQGGGNNSEELKTFKTEASAIMKQGGFELHKWHSNIEALESNDKKTKCSSNQESRTNGKLLGISWNKEVDTLTVNFQSCLRISEPLTKRKILSAINGIYDLLGWASPIIITGKIIFSELCIRNSTWDKNVPEDIRKRWNLWVKSIQNHCNLTVPRSVVTKESNNVVLHGFADASKLAVAAAVYIVSSDETGGGEQNLLVAKSRLAPKGLSIPRLELVAAHTLSKLMAHIMKALPDTNVNSINLWSDSMTTLFWLNNRGTWSKYVRNRVKAINELGMTNWRYVPTDQNPSDLGTRGIPPSKIGDFWLKGPEWLSNAKEWPKQPELVETPELLTEKVSQKKDLALLEKQFHGQQEDWCSTFINSYPYTRLLRITAFIRRFVENCSKEIRTKGPLTSEEIQQAEVVWIRLAQSTINSEEFQLKKDDSGIFRCYGRVSFYHPIFIPNEHPLARKIVERYHNSTLHGGVQTTMSKVRERFWIPKLRKLVKSIKYQCLRCKMVKPKTLLPPPTSTLPSFREEFTHPFATTGVDFAGPLNYKIKKNIKKAYITLFTCASTRAVHLKLCKDQSASTFKHSLKELVARRGVPRLMVSDNAKTFKHTAEWLKTLQLDDDLQHYLGNDHIKWRFNLSRAPWWGGFFERLIGITKTALSKSIGRALLTYKELEETLMDVECFMNNRPLTYLNDEFEQRVITPNILIRGEPTTLLEEKEETLETINDVSSALLET